LDSPPVAAPRGFACTRLKCLSGAQAVAVHWMAIAMFHMAAVGIALCITGPPIVVVVFKTMFVSCCTESAVKDHPPLCISLQVAKNCSLILLSRVPEKVAAKVSLVF